MSQLRDALEAEKPAPISPNRRMRRAQDAERRGKTKTNDKAPTWAPAPARRK
jgi:hypothetical protein